MQVIQLGISGSEVTLPTESRSFSGEGNNLISTTGRAADGTLHTDFIENKKDYTISYGVVTEATKDIIDGIYNSQITNGSFLSFKYTNQADAVVSKTVSMSAPSYGGIVIQNVYYYNGVTISLEEV